jgi:DNA-binding MarR family transcriptional regulator
VSALSALREADKITFPRLQESLGMTAGNLSVHLRKLEEAGYVSVRKSIIFRKTLTRAAITPKGREAFGSYLAEVRKLVDSHASPKAGAKPLVRMPATSKRRRV